jgi:hypothetical protein
MSLSHSKAISLWPLRTNRRSAAVTVLALLLVVFLVSLLTRNMTIQARPSEPQRPEAAGWVSCTPITVAVYVNRIHVKCAAAIGGVQYFAFPTTDSASASRFLSVISAAQVAGRTLTILYDPADTSGTAYGCQASDCRAMQAASFGN